MNTFIFFLKKEHSHTQFHVAAFCATTAKSNSLSRDHMACKAQHLQKQFTEKSLALYRKSLLTPGLQQQLCH